MKTRSKFASTPCLPTLRSPLVGFLTLGLFLAGDELQSAGAQGTDPAIQTNAPPAGLFKNQLGMSMVLIHAGTFKMGSTKAEQDAVVKSVDPKFRQFTGECLAAEGPQHLVRISRPFYMSAHPVTVGQFRVFAEEAHYKTDAERDGKGAWGYNPERRRHEGDKPQYNWRAPGFSQTAQHPVVNVSWNDAVAFCAWLSKKEKKRYQLPSEAQWEYACRAGTQTRFFFGDAEADLKQYVNIADQALQEKFDANAYRDYGFMPWNDHYPFTSPVGAFKPNSWGLYDMHGNVAQWCRDRFDKDYYRHCPQDDPECTKGTSIVYRGGGWYLDARFCRAASRYECVRPDMRGIWMGFRVVCTPAASNP
jgi:formylglycine-generating enzyme required for sulfatase activity